jgi:hypothetical protein
MFPFEDYPSGILLTTPSSGELGVVIYSLLQRAQAVPRPARAFFYSGKPYFMNTEIDDFFISDECPEAIPEPRPALQKLSCSPWRSLDQYLLDYSDWEDRERFIQLDMANTRSKTTRSPDRCHFPAKSAFACDSPSLGARA